MKRLFILLTLIVSVSCTQNGKGEKSKKVIKVSLDDSTRGKFSDKFESIEYILLNAPDSNPLVGPYNFHFTDELIYVRDMSLNNVMVFDQKGNLNRKLSSTGKGPGEFFQIDEFQVTDNQIFVQDTYLYKNLIYDLDGNFISEARNELNNVSFYHHKDYSLYFLGYYPDNGKYGFLRKDNQDGNVQGFYEIPDEIMGLGRFASANGFIQDTYNDRLYISLPYIPEVLQWDKATGTITNHTVFDFGKYNMTPKEKELTGSKKQDVLFRDNLVEDVMLFVPFQDKYFVHLRQGKSRDHFIFLDKEFSIIYQAYDLQNDLDGIGLKFPWTFTHDSIVFLIRSSRFYNSYLEEYSGKKIEVKKGSVHEFFQNFKQDLQEDKWVLAKLKLK